MHYPFAITKTKKNSYAFDYKQKRKKNTLFAVTNKTKIVTPPSIVFFIIKKIVINFRFYAFFWIRFPQLKPCFFHNICRSPVIRRVLLLEEYYY